MFRLANCLMLVGLTLFVARAGAATFTPLGDLAGDTFASDANGVSANGSGVVGRGRSTSGNEAFRWTIGEGMEGLGELDGGLSFSSVAG